MIRITTEWNGVQGSPYYSNMFFAGSLEAEANSAATAVGVFWNAIADKIGTNLDGSVLGDHAVVDPATGQTTEMFVGSAIAVPCTDVGAPLPPASQGLIRWRTGVFTNGREIRGRTFVPLPTENSNEGAGVPGNSYLIDLQAAADALVGGSELHVYSRTGGTIAMVSGAQVWTLWASMRSRRD